MRRESSGYARRGANQSGVRNHNERLLLSMIQRQGEMSGSALARQANLSAQTVSVILRQLEEDGLLTRGTPLRGKVGKPSVPMGLAADGAFAIGLKIGRRSADLLLMDLQGTIRAQVQTTYRYPMPAAVFEFLSQGLETLTGALSERERGRISGIGIAAPFEIWKWHEAVGAPAREFAQWRDTDFAAEVARFSALPVLVENDATAACRAENVYGRGKEFRDYAYFFVGAFIGGGVVLNHSVYVGSQGNAGAFGPMRTVGPDGKPHQLLDTASIYLLEERLSEDGRDPVALWTQPQDWSGFDRQLQPWLDQAACQLANASLSACSVIDFEAVLIDGGFPADVRRALVEKTRAHIATLDARGLIVPRIEEGRIGRKARAIGAACGPIFSQYFLDTNAGLSAT